MCPTVTPTFQSLLLDDVHTLRFCPVQSLVWFSIISVLSFFFFWFVFLIKISPSKYFPFFILMTFSCFREIFLCTPISFFLLPLLHSVNSHPPLKPSQKEVNTCSPQDLHSQSLELTPTVYPNFSNLPFSMSSSKPVSFLKL